MITAAATKGDGRILKDVWILRQSREADVGNLDKPEASTAPAGLNNQLEDDLNLNEAAINFIFA
jgi:hypothetical protein